MHDTGTVLENMVPFLAAGGQICQGHIVALTGEHVATVACSDADVGVEHGEEGSTVHCHVLHTSATPLSLSMGDSVLVWLSPRDDQFSVILGRIGPPIPVDAPSERALSERALSERAPEDRAAQDATPAETNSIAGAAAESNSVPQRQVIEAEQEVVIKCGDSSITLRQDGKILIKGKDVVSRAKRMNRVKGGAVSIN